MDFVSTSCNGGRNTQITIAITVLSLAVNTGTWIVRKKHKSNKNSDLNEPRSFDSLPNYFQSQSCVFVGKAKLIKGSLERNKVHSRFKGNYIYDYGTTWLTPERGTFMDNRVYENPYNVEEKEKKLRIRCSEYWLNECIRTRVTRERRG